MRSLARENLAPEHAACARERSVRGRRMSRLHPPLCESLGTDSLILRRCKPFDVGARVCAVKNFSRCRSARTRCRRWSAGGCERAFCRADLSRHSFRKWCGNAYFTGISSDEAIFVLKNAPAQNFCRCVVAAIVARAQPRAATAVLYTMLSRNPVIFFPLV
jgi:hypothetical protein